MEPSQPRLKSTFLGEANQELVDTALTMCLYFKVVTHNNPELLSEFLEFLYGAVPNISEEVTLSPVLDDIFEMGDECCKSLAKKFLLTVPYLAEDEDINLDDDEPTNSAGSYAARFFHHLLMHYVSRLWVYVNTNSVVHEVRHYSNSHQGSVSLDTQGIDDLQL